ncbi:MAG: hypothetical protein AB3N64_09220 [Puniceicoccaceae bacterium]
MRQIPRFPKTTLMATLATVAFFSGPVQADWQLITDFSTEAREDVYAWKRFGYGTLYFDGLDVTDATNRALYMDGEEPDENRGNTIHVAMPLPEGGVAEGADATLKFDFFTYGAASQFLIGLSDVAITVDDNLTLDNGRLLTPNAFGDYETTSRMRTTFDAREGNLYVVSEETIPVGEWMTCYQYIDNATDTYEIYIKTQADSEPRQLIAEGIFSFAFRNGTTDALETLFLAATRGTGDAYTDVFVVDNIYIDLAGRNAELPEPVTEPKTEALGYPLQDGYIDTADWLGWLYAEEDPFFWNITWNNWCYVDEAGFDQKAGGWVYFYYGDTPWEDWIIGQDGNVDTGNFMQWIYIADGTDYVYSYTLARWIYMPQPSAGNPGAWAYVAPLSIIPAANYTITGTTIAPLIDGIASEGEWADATVISLTYDALVTNGIGTSKIDRDAGSPQPDAVRAEGTAYMTATAYGIYLGFDITDGDITPNPGFGASGNTYDGVQIGIDVNPEPVDRTSTVLLDINPVSEVEGNPTNVYARWAIAGYDPAWGVQASSTLTETGYFVETVIPWSFVTSFGVENPLDAGSLLKLTLIVVDRDETGAVRELLWDSGEGTISIGNAATWPDAVIGEDLGQVPGSYSIPKVVTAPTVDGTIGEGEWLYATHTAATYENWIETNGGTSRLDRDTAMSNPDAERSEGDIYMAATDEALYFGAIINDATPYWNTEFGNASNNNDGVQLCIDLNPNSVDRSTATLWDFTPVTSVGGELTGPANIFTRFALAGYDAAWGVEAAGSLFEGGYIIEVKMPWQTLRDIGFDNPLDAGSLFRIGFIVVDMGEDGVANDLIIDFGSRVWQVANTELWNNAVLDD